jgi:predicted permease
MHTAQQALRSLRRSPLQAALVVITLALGIGTTTAAFSVVHAVLLRPLDYADPGRLVHVRGRLTKDAVENALFAGGAFAALREGVTSLDGLAAVASIRQNLTGGETPIQVQVGWVSTNMFRVLGVRPVLGRDFAADEPPGRLILSHAFFHRYFGGDVAALGASVGLDGRSYQIVGVMPPGFRLTLPGVPADVDVWKAPDDWWQNGDVWSSTDVSTGILRLVGRLEAGTSLPRAQAEVDTIVSSLRERTVGLDRAGFAVSVDPLQEAVTRPVRGGLWLLLAASGLVLLIACGNATNLLLARGQKRRSEIAVRRALGGSRSRIVILLLAESLLMALAGGGLGALLALFGIDALHALKPANLPWHEVRVEPAVLGYALAAAFGCTLIFGLAPALAATRRDLVADLQSGRTTASPAQQRFRSGLVVSQMALSLVLLAGGSLLGISLVRLRSVQPGFDPDRLLTFSVSLPGARYERPLQTDRLLRRLEEAIEALPGVESAGVIWPLPLSNRRWSDEYVAGVVDEGRRAYAELRVVTPDLFETLRTPILEGRTFSPADPRHSVIVSRRLADRAWPGQSPLGREVKARPWGGAPAAFQVVGVVDDVRFRTLREPPEDTLYFDARGWSWTDWEMNVAVRTSGDPRTLVAPIRAELLRLDPLVPMAEVRTMREYVAGDLAANRFALLLLGIFALVAAILVAVGLYGVVSCMVNERTREIGIRLAFGATRGRILGTVVAHGARLAVLGALLGLVGAAAATRLLTSYLYEVAPGDPVVLSVVTAALVALVLGAAFIPARQAATVDPVNALRSE